MLHLDVQHIRPDTLVTRRGLLRASISSAGMLTAAGWRSAAAGGTSAAAGNRTALIQVWLGGGPSQYETYDMKPAAPQEIRGPFQPISTDVPGLEICELLPRQARMMDRFSVLRSLTHDSNIHHAAQHWMQTGHFGPPSKSKPEQTRPSIGSVVSALRSESHAGAAGYVHIANDPLSEPTLLLNFGSAYLGSRHAPLRIKPARVTNELRTDQYLDDLLEKPEFELPALTLLEGVSLQRLESRERLIGELDRRAAAAEGELADYDGYRRQAMEMLVDPQARQAFDLSREPEKLKDRYGRNMWGQAALLSRRLIEAGVSCVTLNTDSFGLAWDSHKNLEQNFRRMMPVYDQMLTALIDDLAERGLYERVVVLVLGEFGRTSKINGNAGRDHWGKAGVALLGGGGIPGGQVIGATDPRGAAPANRPVSPGDLLATVYHRLGIDHRHEFHDRLNRPLPVLSAGEPIAELIES